MNEIELTTTQISAFSVPSAVLDLHVVDNQYITAQGEKVARQNKKRSAGTITSAVQAVATLDGGTLDSLANICRRLQIPSTTGRLSRMIAIMQTNSSDYSTAYAATTGMCQLI